MLKAVGIMTMQPYGIYTLANDVVFDQLVALLNSLKANINADLPVCIIPFDHRLERVKREIEKRPNVTLFEDYTSIERWESFAQKFASSHPEAQRTNQQHPRWCSGKLHRKFAAFDGPFDKFVFFDGDSLAMKPLTAIFEKLEAVDLVFDDWEHAKPDVHAALNIPLIESTSYFAKSDIQPQLHCSSFWGSKRGLFGIEELSALEEKIIRHGEAAWVNGQGWWDDAFLFNYMTLRSGRPLFNFSLSSNSDERTGNCANADPFVGVAQVLYNQDGLKPIHRIHYMGYSSTDFARLCRGEDVNIRYKDTFLHYRFLHEPEHRPMKLKPPSLFKRSNRFIQKAAQKIAFQP
ncbi:MAG: Npun_R2821/Npun_R2822 family protein [Cyanobacteria bacterium P01_D01_bin.71]